MSLVLVLSSQSVHEREQKAAVYDFKSVIATHVEPADAEQCRAGAKAG
jgi:hypothetical protein